MTYGATATAILLYMWLQDSLGAPEQAPKKFFIFITVIVIALISCILYYYYRSKRFDVATQQKIAVETLANIKRSKK